MKIIACVDKNWGIGKDGDLLFHIKEDMKYFKSKTLSKIVIMGRKTFESLPNKKPLNWRINVVLTRDENFHPEGVLVYHDIDTLLKELPEECFNDAFVIGGEEIYKQLIPHCNEAFITWVKTETEADKFLHCMSEDYSWSCVECSNLIEDDKTGLEYQFRRYLKDN